MTAGPSGLAQKLRGGGTTGVPTPTIGYWVLDDHPVAVERLARLGYDYVCIDAQHGQLDFTGVRNALVAIDASDGAGLVRVQANDFFVIGQALDAGARGVIVPMVNSADEARSAVAAVRYPPQGRRSFGPIRAELRVGPVPAETNDEVLCLPMIETAEGLANVEEIAAVPGVDGLYIGPADLRLSLGGATPDDPAYDDAVADALIRVRQACAAAGVVAGMHCATGQEAARHLAAGFTWVSIAHDLAHLEQAAAAHLEAARHP